MVIKRKKYSRLMKVWKKKNPGLNLNWKITFIERHIFKWMKIFIGNLL